MERNTRGFVSANGASARWVCGEAEPDRLTIIEDESLEMLVRGEFVRIEADGRIYVRDREFVL